MCSDSMLADDIVQDVFIKLYKNLSSIQNKQSVHFWLFKTARNEFYTLLRNTKLSKLYTNAEDYDEVELEDDLSVTEEIENNELKSIVINELDKMSAENKEIFVLKEYSGFTYKEIAALLELDIETVKSRLYKIRQRLIKKISKLV